METFARADNRTLSSYVEMVLQARVRGRRCFCSQEPKTKNEEDLTWVLYLNGEEYARVERREDVSAALLEGPARRRGLLPRVRALLGGRR
jgi:hypothetical protein